MDHSEVKHFLKVDHTPAKLDEVGTVLLRAAALIEKRGLSQGLPENALGGLCIMGAINLVVHGSSHDGALDGPIRECFNRVSTALGRGPRCWNDERGRTADEVVAKLRAAAFGL